MKTIEAWMLLFVCICVYGAGPTPLTDPPDPPPFGGSTPVYTTNEIYVGQAFTFISPTITNTEIVVDGTISGNTVFAVWYVHDEVSVTNNNIETNQMVCRVLLPDLSELHDNTTWLNHARDSPMVSNGTYKILLPVSTYATVVNTNYVVSW